MKGKLMHKITGLISLVLVLSMLFSFGAVASYIPDPGPDGIAELFNNSVNTIKEQRPSFQILKSQGIDGTDSDKTVEIFTKMYGIMDLISALLGGKLNTSDLKKTIESLTGSVLIKNSSEEKADSVYKGTVTDKLVSVSGQPYVAAITGDDIGSYEYQSEQNGAYTIIVRFNEEINPTADGTMGKIFDLVNAEKLQTFIRTIIPKFDIQKAVLKYQNAYAECRVDAQGKLTYYKTHYEINIGLLDSLKDGFDFLDLSNVEFFDKSIYIVEAEYKNFNWNPILFGDLNSDDKIDPGDARLVLRSVAKMDTLSDSQQLAADIDGDGKVGPSDARLILRHVAKLGNIEYKLIPTVREKADAKGNSGSEGLSSGSFASPPQVLSASEQVLSASNGSQAAGDYYLIGDADANGKVDTADARIILRVVAKLDTVGDSLNKVLDADEDGKVGAGDARKALRIVAKLDPLSSKKAFVLDRDLYYQKPAPWNNDDGGNNGGSNNDNPGTGLRAPRSPYFDKPDKQYQDLNDYEYEVIRLVNVERAKAGLQPLEVSFELAEVARKRSTDMAHGLPFSHYYLDPNGKEYGEAIAFQLLKQRNIKYGWAGENIAAGHRTPQTVVTAWMNSPGHRENILNPNYTSIGVGFTDKTVTMYETYWTQIFASPQK